MRLDRAALLLAAALLILYNALYTGCHTPRSALAERGHDPWVFRSVLDERPRMTTLALADGFWVAYDAANGGLYKVWEQGVNFEGAVYTTAHGPQPTSTGDAYFISEIAHPWQLVEHGKTYPAKFQYRGHRFEGPQAVLQYELTTQSGKKIYIDEKPEYRMDNYGKPGLERTFNTLGVPEGIEIFLQVELASVMSEADIFADKFVITREREKVIPGAHLLQLEGQLYLKSNGQTEFTVFFHPEPTIPAEEAEEESGPKGLTLIDRSDCRSCHNAEVKTVGPAYVDIAKKYKFTSYNVSRLAQKVMKGGAGNWGQVPMTAHPDLQKEDAAAMITYIMGLDGEELQETDLSAGLSWSIINTDEAAESGQGLAVNLYDFGRSLEGMPEITAEDKPVYSGIVAGVNAVSDEDFGDYAQQFYVQLKGYIDIPRSTNYVFRLISDDGSVLRIDDKIVVDHNGFHGPSPKDSEVILEAGKHPITIDFFQAGGGKALSLQWVPYGAQDFRVIPPALLSYEAKDIKEAAERVEEEVSEVIPGDAAPLEGVHPAFEVSTIRPGGFQPKVGGLDFLSDGRLVVSTWDPDGSVYMLEGIDRKNREKIKLTRIAKGLAEPLGLCMVDDEIYVLQKQELTHLIDHNYDGIIDEYRTLCNGWQVSANFHEFAFGLIYQDGYFYCTLATAINPGGASTQPQIPDRGRAIRISKKTGEFEFIAQGLRTPNGIGIGVDEELFIADNQGDWLPSCKILHLKEGAFYGSRSVDFAGTEDLQEMPPVVWLPQDEIGNSPSQPTYLNVGPYQGQMIHGEVTHGGIKRVFVEQVDDEYQGCVFRFTQGLEGGVNRLVWGPDNALYIGEVGNPGNWGHYGKYPYGLQRMRYTGKSAFEMLAVRAQSNGMEIEFTEPLKEGEGMRAADYLVQQWWYLPTKEYGGPKMDLEELDIRSIQLSDDRKKAFLELAGMKPGHVVYIRLNHQLTSEKDRKLWTTEAWYTLNRIPGKLQATNY